MKTYNLNDFVKQDSELFRILRKLPKPDVNGPWIAGGSLWKSIEGMPLNCDLDFFFASPQQQEVYLRIMRSIPYVNHVVSEKKNDYNTTFGFHVYDNGYNKTIPIQYVSFRYASSLEEILNGFDFTVCQFGWDGRTFFAGDNSLQHLSERKIVFNNVHNSLATAIHLRKYLEKGFVIPTESQAMFNEIMLGAATTKRPKSATTDDDDDAYPRPIEPPPRANISNGDLWPAFEAFFSTPAA
jgi:hypothetical protein